MSLKKHRHSKNGGVAIASSLILADGFELGLNLVHEPQNSRWLV